MIEDIKAWSKVFLVIIFTLALCIAVLYIFMLNSRKVEASAFERGRAAAEQSWHPPLELPICDRQ